MGMSFIHSIFIIRHDDDANERALMIKEEEAKMLGLNEKISRSRQIFFRESDIKLNNENRHSFNFPSPPARSFHVGNFSPRFLSSLSSEGSQGDEKGKSFSAVCKTIDIFPFFSSASPKCVSAYRRGSPSYSRSALCTDKICTHAQEKFEECRKEKRE